MIAESISENRIIVNLAYWTRQAIEFDSIKSCEAIENSAELAHMQHNARNAASEPSNTNNLWITIQLWSIQAGICIQQYIFQI